MAIIWSGNPMDHKEPTEPDCLQAKAHHWHLSMGSHMIPDEIDEICCYCGIVRCLIILYSDGNCGRFLPRNDRKEIGRKVTCYHENLGR